MEWAADAGVVPGAVGSGVVEEGATAEGVADAVVPAEGGVAGPGVVGAPAGDAAGCLPAVLKRGVGLIILVVALVENDCQYECDQNIVKFTMDP